MHGRMQVQQIYRVVASIQPIVSAIKIRKMVFEVNDTDSPAGEVWLLNIYLAR